VFLIGKSFEEVDIQTNNITRNRFSFTMLERANTTRRHTHDDKLDVDDTLLILMMLVLLD